MRSYLPNLLLFSTFLIACSSVAETSHIREFAKNKTPVYIITAGDVSKVAGERLRQQIVSHRDFKGGNEKIKAVTLPEAAAAAKGKDFADASHILIFCGEESFVVPYELKPLLRIPENALSGSVTRMRAIQTRGSDKGLAHDVAIYAPDARRLDRAMEIFGTRSFSHYSVMGFSDEFSTNRVTVFSDGPEAAELSRGWGSRGGSTVWNEIEEVRLGDRALASRQRADDKEATRAYFVIGRPSEYVPEPMQEMISRQPNSIFAAKWEEDRSILFYAPTQPLMQGLLRRFPNVDSVPSTGFSTQPVDLTGMKVTTLLVHVNDVPSSVADAVRTPLAARMRSIGMPVEERGTVLEQLQREVATEGLAGADTAKKLRAQGIRYVWLLDVMDTSGNVSYSGSERRLGECGNADHKRPNPPMPDRRYKDDDNARRRQIREWEQECRRLEAGRAYHQYREPFQWICTLTATQEGSARVYLKIIDLESGLGKVVWEAQAQGSKRDSSVVETRNVTVEGEGARPNSILGPSGRPPDLSVIVGACEEAAANALDQAMLEVRLGERPAAIQVLPDGSPAKSAEAATKAAPASSRGEPKPAPPAATNLVASPATIVELGKKVMTVAGGNAARLKQGAVITAIVKRIIRDGGGRAIDIRVVATIKAKVSYVGKTVDLTPINAAEAKKLAEAAKGMEVSW